MDDGSQTEVSTEGSIKETPLGGKEFSGSIETKDPLAAKTTPAPEGVPEKFWDPIEGKLRTDDLIKSYQSLEAKLGQPKTEDEDKSEDAPEDKPEDAPEDKPEGEDEDEPEDKPEGEDEDKDEDKPDADKVDFQAALDAAQKTYAETGELPEEQRKPFLDMGFSDQQIDLYLNGVKATEAALHNAAYKAAGSEDAYKAAVEWAAKGGMTEKQILAFNSQTSDVETIGPAVVGLMAAFKAANPGEGNLTNLNGGVPRGDLYENMDEFQQELAKADKVRDQVARRKAIDKLRRSREAGTIKSSRRQPFGG